MNRFCIPLVTLVLSGVLCAPVNADDAEHATLDKYRAFFVTDPAVAVTIESLMAAPWVDSFAVRMDEDSLLEAHIANCATFFAARDSGLEPTLPSVWPVYRGYGLRCLALAQMALMNTVSGARGDQHVTQVDVVSDFPLSEMFTDLDLDDAQLDPAPLTDGVAQLRIDADTLTFEVIARYGAASSPAAHLLVHGETSSIEGTYSEVMIFVLEKSAPEAAYRLVTRIGARLDD